MRTYIDHRNGDSDQLIFTSNGDGQGFVKLLKNSIQSSFSGRMTRVTVMARMTHTTRITRMTVIARMTHMTPMTRVIHTTLKLCHRITLATAIRPKTLLVLTYQTARLFDDEQCQQANSTDAWQFPWKHAVGDGSLLEELGGSPTSNVR